MSNAWTILPLAPVSSTPHCLFASCIFGFWLVARCIVHACVWRNYTISSAHIIGLKLQRGVDDVFENIMLQSFTLAYSYIYLKLPSLFVTWLFWTFHNKLHNMKALVILSHHDHHFSHILVSMKKKKHLEYFREKKVPTAQHFNIGAHIGICAQMSRNTLLYLPSFKREFPILLLMLISAWLTVSRAFNSDEKHLLNY